MPGNNSSDVWGVIDVDDDMSLLFVLLLSDIDNILEVRYCCGLSGNGYMVLLIVVPNEHEMTGRVVVVALGLCMIEGNLLIRDATVETNLCGYNGINVNDDVFDKKMGITKNDDDEDDL